MLIKDGGHMNPEPLVVFLTLGDKAKASAVGVVAGLREKGMRVIEDFSGGTLKKRMKRADKLGARWTVIIGDDELAGGVAAVKDMRSATQEKVPLKELYERLGREN